MFVERESGTYLKYIFPYRLIVRQHQINVRLQLTVICKECCPFFMTKISLY